jgi:hypothetical protein
VNERCCLLTAATGTHFNGPGQAQTLNVGCINLAERCVPRFLRSEAIAEPILASTLRGIAQHGIIHLAGPLRLCGSGARDERKH